MTTATLARRTPKPDSLAGALAGHWPEYLMEAAGLGLFMLSACAFAVLLEHPASPLNQSIENPGLRRFVMGLAMGSTAVGIILSPWGKRSGAHLNPSVTLTFLSLGKIAWRDAIFYIASQFAGGVLGVIVAAVLVGFPLRHSAVNFAVTVPGPRGELPAFAGEVLISGALMMAVLLVSNHRRLSPYTPFFAGVLVAGYITVEAPISGMSMNPARTFGSAFSAGDYTSLWIYFTAPVLGMFLAGQIYRVFRGAHAVYCAKLHHANHQPCIFRCEYGRM